MPSRLAWGALLLCAACARHVAPAPGEDRTVVSGVPVAYGSDQDLPKGTRVIWDFGDGTPPVEGARVEHAFPRAGAYRVTETVVDADGQKRSASAKATVLRRPVPAAVPVDVRAAWVHERPWERVNVHRATAAKLALSDVFEETAAELSDALGFDALDARAAQENGFDPDEGLALFTVPQDPEALVAAVGSSDDAKALAAVKRLLSRASEGRFAGGPFQLTDTRTQNGVPVLLGAGRGGEQVAVVLRYGYLYLRLPGLTDPTLALRGVIALPPAGGLAADPGWQLALEHVGQGDAVFFSRPSEKDGQGRFATQLGLAAFSLLDGPEALQMKLFAQPRRLSGEELQKTFKPLKPPPDLAARLPRGPAAYVKVSGRPDALWRELLKASQADANRARERAEELTGLNLETDLLPAFTGNFGIALYLDAAALLEAVLGEEVGAFDRSGFLVAAELAPERARTLQQAIDRKVSPAQRVPIGGTTLWKLGGGAAMAAVKDGFFYFAVGGLPQDEEEPEPAPPPSFHRVVPPIGTRWAGLTFRSMACCSVRARSGASSAATRKPERSKAPTSPPSNASRSAAASRYSAMPKLPVKAGRRSVSRFRPVSSSARSRARLASAWLALSSSRQRASGRPDTFTYAAGPLGSRAARSGGGLSGLNVFCSSSPDRRRGCAKSFICRASGPSRSEKAARPSCVAKRPCPSFSDGREKNTASPWPTCSSASCQPGSAARPPAGGSAITSRSASVGSVSPGRRRYRYPYRSTTATCSPPRPAPSSTGTPFCVRVSVSWKGPPANRPSEARESRRFTAASAFASSLEPTAATSASGSCGTVNSARPSSGSKPFSCAARASRASNPSASDSSAAVSSKTSLSASFAAVARCTLTRSHGRSCTQAARTSTGTAAGTGRRSTVAFAPALRFCPSASTTVSVTRYAPARGKACSTRAPSTGGVPSPKSQITRVPFGRS